METPTVRPAVLSGCRRHYTWLAYRLGVRVLELLESLKDGMMEV
ncbi:MAG TPA: hypothetical protein ACFYD3_09940 [Candidatus Hypogeohydataceae bacterium YC41]